MPSKVQKTVSIALFRMILLSFVRIYWRPRLLTPDRLPPGGPCFFYGNHSNRWDPFILNCFTPWGDPTAGVMTREFFRSSFISWTLGSVDIHPTRKRIAEPGLVRTLFRMIREERKIVIYPEGGSRWTGRPEPWINSTAKVFVRCGVPVYPIRMHGSYASWPRWAEYPRPGRVEVEVLDPIVFDRSTPEAEALSRLRAPMDFDESVTPEHLRPRWAFRPASGIHTLLYRDPITGRPDEVFTPDGTHVTNRDGSLRLKMLPDSRLRDARNGDIHLTGDLYDTVRSLPLEPDADGALLRNAIDFSTEASFPDLVPHGRAEALLFPDSLHVDARHERRRIPLERLLAVDIERSYKLQLFLADEMIQLSFRGGGSALAWKDALCRLHPDLAA